MEKKKRNRLIIISGILCAIVAALLFLGLYSGYIPVVGKCIAVSKVNQYSENKVDDAKYDWLSAKYRCTLDNGTELTFDLNKMSIFDEKVSRKYNKKASTKYQTIVQDFATNLSMPKDIDVSTEIRAIDNNIIQKAYILSVYNTEDLSEEESFGMPSEIAQLFIELMGEEFHFIDFQLIYADINGMYELITSNDNMKILSAKALKDDTDKLKIDELPGDYLEWLGQQDMN